MYEKEFGNTFDYVFGHRKNLIGRTATPPTMTTSVLKITFLNLDRHYTLNDFKIDGNLFRTNFRVPTRINIILVWNIYTLHV